MWYTLQWDEEIPKNVAIIISPWESKGQTENVQKLEVITL